MIRHRLVLNAAALARGSRLVGRPPHPLGLIPFQRDAAAGARPLVHDPSGLPASPWAKPPDGKRPWVADLALLIPDGFPELTGADWLDGLLHSGLRAGPGEGMLVASALLRRVRLRGVRVEWVTTDEAVACRIPLHWPPPHGPRVADLAEREDGVRSALGGELAIEVEAEPERSLVPFTLWASSEPDEVIGRGAVRLVDGEVAARDARLALALTRWRGRQVATAPFWYERGAAVDICRAAHGLVETRLAEAHGRWLGKR